MVQESKITPEAVQEQAHELYEQKTSPEKEKARELTPQEQSLKEEIIHTARTAQPAAQDDGISQAVSDLLSLDDRAQLSELIRLAFTKNVNFALKVATRLENPLVMDTLHDVLARDELYQKLLSENKL